jgi:MinD superfamily P-loop ATPase
MAFVIDEEECVSCGTCFETCEHDAVIEKEDCYEIDPEKCKDCGDCASECPVEAISQS